MKSLLRTRLGIITASLWVALGAVFFGVGGDDPSRVTLVGTVKVDGRPLDHGTIRFFLKPLLKQPVLDVGGIDRGHFTLEGRSPLVPGTYCVWILGQVKQGVSVPAGQDAAEVPLPDRYNTKSELEVVIPHNGTHHLDFNLKL